MMKDGLFVRAPCFAARAPARR